MGSQRNGFEPRLGGDGCFRVQTVEILRRPGQTLGFYIREGNGCDRGAGIFISRIATGSETSGLLRVMDEILAVDKVDVTRMSLDDVAILMSIPKRLVLTIRTRKPCPPKNVSCPSLSNYEAESSATCRPSPAHAHNSPSSTSSSLSSCDPLRQQQQQQVYVRKGRVASVGDVTDSEFGGDVIQSYGGGQQQFCAYGTMNSGVRRSLDVARSLSHRPWTLEQDATFRRLKGSLPGTRERAVDILEELIGQRQSRRNHVIGRWSEHRKSLVDSPGRSGGGGRRRGADYSSDTDAHLGPDQTGPGPGSGAGARTNRMSESQLFHDQKAAFCNEAILLRSGLQSGGGGRSLSNTRENSPERYSSDSESNGSKRGGVSDRAHLAAFARHSSYLNRLLGRDDRYATLPRQLHSVANSQELRHWLRKLDNLAVELESQQLATNNSSSSSSGHASIGGPPTESAPGRRERTLSASTKMECYTAQEYRSWVGGRQTPSPSSVSSDHHPPLSVSSSLSSSPRIQPSSAASSSVAASRKLSADSSVDFRNLQQQPQTGSESTSSTKIQTDPSSSGSGQRRLLSLSSSTQTWRGAGGGGGGGGAGHHRSPSNSSSSKSSLAAASRSRQSPSASSAVPSTSSASSSFQSQIPSKQVVDRLAACSILKDLSLAKKPTPLRTEDFVPYPAPSQVIDDLSTRRRSDPGPYDGSVYVHVICGHGLKASKTMLRDLYCVLAVDSVNKARTMIRTGAINFDWNEDFEVDVFAARRMSFLVYSWDPATKHTLCFSASVSLQAFLRGAQPHAHGLRRLALRLEPKGVLYVELICRDPRAVFQRIPATDQGAIFGASLETIVRREATSDNIPVVIRRCVDEIESRGLSHVGLYRLCGSARRKEQLKSDFECNASGTELTPQAVSDISVITGVVKDFLLRLPEPVFTSALHQMLLDAISVRIPEDPEGNSKLMFSVIECLPKINQDVVAFLMNHLKRIVSKKETNKMDAVSLSACFGPIMLCPPQDASPLKQTADFKRQAEVLRYILDIWPNDQDGSLKRSPRGPGTPRSDLLPRQQSQDSNQVKPSAADSSRSTTTALVHAAPDKTSFC